MIGRATTTLAARTMRAAITPTPKLLASAPRASPRGVPPGGAAWMGLPAGGPLPPGAPSQRAAGHAACAAAARPDADTQKASLARLGCNFCKKCGSPMEMAIPEGDDSYRHVCSNGDCGFVDYFNPKMVVGCLVEHEGSILLCKRAIEPCAGKWTVPAGYMEMGESSREGASRETWEEARAAVDVIAPYAHFDIPVISQAYILFRGTLAAPYTHSPGPETLETKFFAPEDIPFDEIAFSSVDIALRHYIDDMRSGNFHMHHAVIAKEPGSKPNEAWTFSVEDHMKMLLSTDED